MSVTRIKARIRRTIDAANRANGRGEVVKLVWHSNGIQGLAVREIGGQMDGVQFQVLHRGVYFLDKARALLP